MIVALDSTNSSNVQMHDKVIGQIWNLERDSSSNPDENPDEIWILTLVRYRHTAKWRVQKMKRNEEKESHSGPDWQCRAAAGSTRHHKGLGEELATSVTTW